MKELNARFSRPVRVLALTVLTFACLTTAATAAKLEAEIRRTEAGVPHLKADSFKDLGFAQGYLTADESLCSIAEDLVYFRGDYAKYFGRGPDDEFVLFSVFQQAQDERKVVERQLAKKAPKGPSKSARQMVAGFVRGYNHFLSSTNRATWDPACRDEPWVAIPTTRKEIWLASINEYVFQTEIAAAVPPNELSAKADATTQPRVGLPDSDAIISAASPNGPNRPRWMRNGGSNGQAYGRKATLTGRGLTLTNPHSPWWSYRSFRQLTIPGKYNAFGWAFDAFLGSAIGAGITNNVSYSVQDHDQRFWSLFQLKLATDDPTVYIVDGRRERMKRIRVPLQVKNADGTVTKEVHEIFRTRFGYVVAGDGLPWTEGQAFAVRSLNESNLRRISDRIARANAKNVGELQELRQKWQADPYQQMVASDQKGRVLYSPSSLTINMPRKKFSVCGVKSDLGTELYEDNVALLNGSRSKCALTRAPGATVEGAFGPGSMPTVRTQRYVSNSNDGPRAVNGISLQSGYSRFYEGSGEGNNRVNGLRTRTKMGFSIAERRLRGEDGYPGRKMSMRLLERRYFDSESYTSILLKDQLVAECQSQPNVEVSEGNSVSLVEACNVLANWDGRATRDSAGAVLWRHILTRWPARNGCSDPNDPEDTSACSSPDVYRIKYDPSDPVGTPRDLDVNDPAILLGMARAVQEFEEQDVPLDITNGESWIAERADGTAFPGNGCGFQEGCFNAFDVYPSLIRDTPISGYKFEPQSALTAWMVSGFSDSGRPQGRFINSLSQSQNPISPYHSNQTELWSNMETLPLRFSEKEIRSSPAYQSTRIIERRNP